MSKHIYSAEFDNAFDACLVVGLADGIMGDRVTSYEFEQAFGTLTDIVYDAWRKDPSGLLRDTEAERWAEIVCKLRRASDLIETQVKAHVPTVDWKGRFSYGD